MSVLVPSLTAHHHHSSLFSNNARRHHGPISAKSMETTDQDADHVPFGVVNSMKQRFLNKVSESYVFHPPSTLSRPSLSKPSSRQPSNENLLQTKSLTSPLKRTTRLSRSQDNLSHHVTNVINEQFTSYLQPKQDVIIVDTSTSQENDEPDGHEEQLEETKLRSTAHRQPYSELHCDEVPKPGTVTTVKNMFERQIRLSRYDADKLLTNATPAGSRMNSQHRDFPSPSRSRSMSPNDLAVRQRRTNLCTGLSLPVPSSYPDLVISHTPPTEPTKPSVNIAESTLINTHPTETPSTSVHSTLICKEKKFVAPLRNSLLHEPAQPLTVIVDEPPPPLPPQTRPHLLQPSTINPSESVDCQPLDFKSRLALFNRTNPPAAAVAVSMPTIQEKKTPVSSLTLPTKSATVEEKKESSIEPLNTQLLTLGIARSVVNTAKAVTFYGGTKLNSNQKSSLPSTIPAPPAPSVNVKAEVSSSLVDVLRAPDVVGGNVKLNKSSISSGSRKDGRVQFVDDVDTFEYPSFELALAEFGGNLSDDEQNHRSNSNDDEDEDEHSLETNNNEDEQSRLKILLQEKFQELAKSLEDVDDDELERLARINAKFNSNENSLKPKGTLHTFRPTHLDQYELGSQHGSQTNGKMSDKAPSSSSSSVNTYSILARQKLLQSAENSPKNFTHHPVVKTNGAKLNSDLTTSNVQWSSMSTTTDLLF